MYYNQEKQKTKLQEKQKQKGNLLVTLKKDYQEGLVWENQKLI